MVCNPLFGIIDPLFLLYGCLLLNSKLILIGRFFTDMELLLFVSIVLYRFLVISENKCDSSGLSVKEISLLNSPLSCLSRKLLYTKSSLSVIV